MKKNAEKVLDKPPRLCKPQSVDATKLKSLLDLTEISPKELAEFMGVSVDVVHAWLNGEQEISSRLVKSIRQATETMKKEELKQILEEFELSQTELARRIGVSSRTVSDWTAGRYKIHPAFSKIIRATVNQIQPTELKKLLKRSSLSQKKLAELIEVSEAAISLWVSGKRKMHPAFGTLIRQVVEKKGAAV